eukprot:TRINITY_DN252_c0_g1_i1.p1 TRINITY_DN252_c0_g1~~TRINITY_DN252_c0_g1_i1.p1  ORF type:complete len:619 (-),score=100.20 TRINITY_DN252_c0_g1_i1:2678-4534(-)
MKRRYIVSPSFQLYGGIGGLYDYGPVGCALKANVENLWRNHFVLEEEMLEYEGSCLTPESVLKSSGHVDKFADLMVKDVKLGTCYRADKYLVEYLQNQMAQLTKKKKLTPELANEYNEVIDHADTYTKAQLTELYKKYQIKSEKGNELSPPVEFNLIFETQIGPQGGAKGFLRPETAQGLFVNFKKLLEFNNGRVPFAASQIGLGFRNEISPRAGLLRLREFAMAEIEHFLDPENKAHPKFATVENVKLPLLSAVAQEAAKPVIERELTLKTAVEKNVIKNQTLAYYMARTYQFLQLCGIPSSAIRFRQHMKDEMAHYAKDCWDAEVECSYGWIEVAGHADRGCYDLTCHAKRAKEELVASRSFKEPKKIKIVKVIPNKKAIGPKFGAGAGAIISKLENLDKAEIATLEKLIAEKKEMPIAVSPDKTIMLDTSLVQVTSEEKTVVEEKFVPHVIEPSFGIGRIVYVILEHCYKVRQDEEKRSYFIFPPVIAPVKCSILPLIPNDKRLTDKIGEIKKLLNESGISSKVDDSGTTIGRRYARTDEVGIPFAITIDFDTLKDNTVTLREINTMAQIRLPLDKVAEELAKLSGNVMTWEQLLGKYPKFTAGESAQKTNLNLI